MCLSHVVVAFLSTLLVIDFPSQVVSSCNQGSQSGTAECYDEKECTDDSIYCRNRAACRGFLACSYANLTDNYNNDCSGDYGCLSAIMTGDTVSNYGVHCDGNFGCQEVVTDGVGKFYYIRGRAAAHKSYFKNGLYYYVTGNWALSDGMIDSGDQEVVTIQLKGDDCASGATVLCREASECYLDCTTTSSCDSANITCFGDASESNCDCNGEYCPSINYVSTSSDFELKRQLEEDIVNEFLQRQASFRADREEKTLQLLEKYNYNERIVNEKLIDWNEQRFAEFMKMFDSELDSENENGEENSHFVNAKIESHSMALFNNNVILYSLIIGALIGISITLIGQKLINIYNQHKTEQYTPL